MMRAQRTYRQVQRVHISSSYAPVANSDFDAGMATAQAAGTKAEDPPHAENMV